MDELEIYTYEYLLEQALARVPNTLDKREGSIIYDALAPACYSLAEFYLELYIAYNNVFIDTAVGEYLDLKVAERGLKRKPATFAERRIDFEDLDGNVMEVEIGSRFSTISSTNPIIYAVTQKYFDTDNNPVPGAYVCVSETSGVVGNSYTGEMSTVSNISGLGLSTLSTLIVPAEDEETDEALRARFKASIVAQSYGGNRSEYVNDWVLPIDGVGACQIYPVWNGGGTVLVSIIDSTHNPCSTDFISKVKETLDPTEGQGTGLGLAPIGHTVTVTTAKEVTVPISVTVQLQAEYSSADVQTPITEAITAIIETLRSNWGNWSNVSGYTCVLYQSYIISSILSIKGVINVREVLIDGKDADYTFVETSALQELPKLGEVRINV